MRLSKGLQYLNAIGLADWRGADLTEKNKSIKYKEKGDLASFIKELEGKLGEMEGKKKSKIVVPTDIEDKVEVEEGWVEVQYSPDVILKVKRSKIKELMM
jgi:hypothetical protein